MRVLIVDDDPKFRATIHRGLDENGITCHEAGSVDEAEAVLRSGLVPDLILLDVMMPDRQGWELLTTIRDEEREVPVIFLTARHEVEERVRGLELGADDYVIKPFAFSELLARIQAVIRRRNTLPVLEVGDLRLDLAGRLVERGGKRIEMSAREFDFLRTLAEKPGVTHSRKELLSQVWGIEFDPGTNVVDVLVARLRRKLAPTGGSLIDTVVGEGYRLLVHEEA